MHLVIQTVYHAKLNFAAPLGLPCHPHQIDDGKQHPQKGNRRNTGKNRDALFCEAEKEAWLDRYLPEIDTQHRIFVPCGSPKSAFVPEGIKKSDVLLDDYSQNLHEWKGKGIKLMNGINGTRGSWQGARISADMTAATLCRELGAICKEKAVSEPNKQDGGIRMYIDGDFKEGKLTLDPEDVKTIKRI